LVLVGDGDCRGELQELASELGIPHRVHFLGSISKTESAYVAFDVFALSSFAEGTPMCILEAMACGTPIVSTAVGGIPKLLDDGRLGVLVKSDDVSDFGHAIANVLGQDNTVMIEHAQAACHEHFSTEAMTNAYEQLYSAP
jgi:glycosyltransferase involved in cell wall biosynthesis